MTFTILYNSKHQYCLVTITGDYIRPHDALEIQAFTKNYEQETKCYKFIFDFRTANILGGKVQVYATGLMMLDPEGTQKNQLVAAVYKKNSAHLNIDYLEKVFIKEGYKFKGFVDIEFAIKWLSK